MAYVSDETGRREVYVVPFPNAADARLQVSPGGGTEPVWLGTGRELFYRDGQGDMVAVTVSTEPTLSLGSTSVLFPAAEFRGGTTAAGDVQNYDVAPAGERFIMLRPVSDDAENRVILMLGFDETLRQRTAN